MAVHSRGLTIGGATPKFLGGPNPFHLFSLLSPLLFLFLPSYPSLPFSSVPLVVARPRKYSQKVTVWVSDPPTGSAAEAQQKANLCILALKSDVWWHQFY